MNLILQRAGVAELADAPDLGSGAVTAWEFKSLRPHHAHTSGSDSVVECDLAKVEVAGSNPVFRSIHYTASLWKANCFPGQYAGVAQR